MVESKVVKMIKEYYVKYNEINVSGDIVNRIDGK